MGNSCFKSKTKTHPTIAVNPIQNGISYFAIILKS